MTSSRLLVSVFVVACNGGGQDDSPGPSLDAPGAANATFNWAITDNGVPSTCAGAGADEVKIEAAPENGVPILHTFQCVLLPGTLALPAGRYAVAAKLYDSRGPQQRAFAPAQPLTVPASGTAPAMMFNFAL
jgi:hypothetical protein